MRRVFAYLLVAPLALLGEYVAHQASYLSVHGGSAHLHLNETGHGYLDNASTVFSLLFGLMSLLVIIDAVRVTSGRDPADLPLWPLALLGPITFTVQEHLERWLQTGQFPWSATLEPTFALGLWLQLPTAFLAYLVARFITGTARKAAHHLRTRLGRVVAVQCALTYADSIPTHYVDIFRVDATLKGHRGRGPPARSLSLH